MYWVRIRTGVFKGHLGIVHEVDNRSRYKNGKLVISVQVEAPRFPFIDYTLKQIIRIPNPNNDSST